MTGPVRTVSLFRNGRSQAIRIPKEFELPGTDVDFPEIDDPPPEPVEF